MHFLITFEMGPLFNCKIERRMLLLSKFAKYYYQKLSMPKFLFNFAERRSMMIAVKD